MTIGAGQGESVNLTERSLAVAILSSSVVASATAHVPHVDPTVPTAAPNAQVPAAPALGYKPRQELGLMFVTQLSCDEGMLFSQKQPQIVSMWMKNTLIPLDMLFIDRRGRIVCLLETAKPRSLEILSCPKPVKAVLEIGGGEARRRGIQIGDKVVHATCRN